MMAGYLGPVESVEKAYRKGHSILLDLACQREKMLRPSDDDGSMVEPAPTDSESVVCCRHEGVCFTGDIGFVDVLDNLGEVASIACTHGMLKSNIEEQGSMLLIDGNLLSSRLVIHPSRKLRYLACFKPRPESLNPLLDNVTELLSVLLLRDCGLLRQIDIPLHKFKVLTVLEISGLSNVPIIKPSESDPPKEDLLLQNISELSQLRSLHLSDFLIEDLPVNFFAKLTELRWVALRGCSKLVSLPSVRGLRHLKMLDVSYCSALHKILSSVFQNPDLQMLDFSYTSITNIPNVRESPNLTHLLARDVKVAVLGGLRHSSNLEVLDLSGAKSVKVVKQLAGNKDLTVLDLSRTQIRSIDYLPELVHLHDLILQECSMLTKLPPVGKLTKLEAFDVSGCGNLMELPEGLSDLKSLKKLNLSLTGVTQLPSFANLTSLVKLSLRGLKVVSLEGLESLANIEELDLNSLQTEPPQKLKFDFLQNLVNLQIVDLSHTPVTQLPGLSKLKNLRKLILEKCRHLEAVPDRQPLTNLDLSLPDSTTVASDNTDQVKSIQSLTEIGPRMGFLSEVRNRYDTHQELSSVSNTNPRSGFDRFQDFFETLSDVVAHILQAFSEPSSLVHIANIQALEKRFRSVPCDLRFIRQHIGSLNRSHNRKSSEVLLQGLVDTAIDILDNDNRFDYTDLMELLRVVVKLKLLIHRNQVDDLREDVEDVVAEEEKEVDDVVAENKRQLTRTNNMKRVIDRDAIIEIFETLDSSYNTLTDLQKKCLLCFSIFPCSEYRDRNTREIKLKSLVIKKSILIHWWYGEQFFEPHHDGRLNPTAYSTPNPELEPDADANQNSVERTGEVILKVLADKGFIEPVMIKGVESGRCCMRAYIHSFVSARAEEERFFDFSKHGKLTPHFTHSKKACLLTSQRNSSSSYKIWANYTNFPEKLESFKGVRTLFNMNESLIDIDVEWFSRMKGLSVLHLGSWCSGVRGPIEVVNRKFLKELNKMKQLRLLNLRGLPSIKKLPDSVSKLTNLRLLNLRRCRDLTKLPDDIGSLKNLTHLDITHCRLLSDLPKGIRLLSKLEVLKGFRITGARQKKGICKLEDLLNLGSLRTLSLSVDKKEALRNREHVLVLKRMKNLDSLKITWESRLAVGDGNQIGQQQQDDTEQKVVKGWPWLKRNCWERQISQHNISTVTSSNLRKLVLHGLPDKTASYLLTPAELEKLEELHIIAGNLRILNGGTNDGDKWNVKTLRMKYLNNIRFNWVEFRCMFPHVTYLEMLECKKLALFPCDGEGVWRIPS